MDQTAPKPPQPSDVQAFAALAPFGDLTEAEHRAMLEAATLRSFSWGETLFSEGDAAQNLFLGISGFVRLMRITPGGDQIVIHHGTPGDLFGISTFLGNSCHSLTAKGASDGKALVWSASVWSDLAAQVPSLKNVTLRSASTRLLAMQDRIVEMATRPVAQRIALSLMRLAEQAGRMTEFGTEIDFPMTRQDISDLTGANMHSVSRYMSAWQREGIVMSMRRRVIVTEPTALQRISDGPKG